MTQGVDSEVGDASPANARLIGILTTDTELVVKSWDGTLARMTGIPADHAVGLRLDEVVHELRDRPLLGLLREPLLSGSAQVLAPALHKYLIPCPPAQPSADFEQMQQRVVVGALRNEDRAVGLVITIEDVTARVERERHLARQLRAGNPGERLEAVRELAHVQPTDGVGPLASAIADDDWQVRRAAVRALAARQDASLVEALVNALRDGHHNFSLLSSALQLLTLTGVDFTEALTGLVRDPDSDLRIQAALALGTQRRPEAVAALLAALDDADPNVRFHAIESLGKLAPASAIEPLSAVAASGDFFLAYPAVEALVRIGDPTIAPRLAPLLSDPMLAGAVADALAQIGDESAIGPLVEALNRGGAPTVTVVVDAIAGIHRRAQAIFGSATEIEDVVSRTVTPKAVSRILEAMTGASGEQLRNLVVVVGWLRAAAVPAALARLLGSDDVNHEVVEALVRFGSTVVDLLIELVSQDDRAAGPAAVVALGRIGDRRATPALTALLDADHRELWILAAGALARIGDARAFEALLPLLGDPDAAVRQATVGALNSIGHPGMASRIAGLLDDPNPNTRESAVKIAGYFGYPECVERVIAACRDPEELVRRSALGHLPYFDDPRALELLAAALVTETPRGRAAAAEALGAMAGSGARALLHKALDDSESWVRYFAAIGLGRHGDASAVDRLSRAAVSDAAPPVRVAAIEALGAVGGQSIAELLETLAGEDGEIGDAAVRVMGRFESDGDGDVVGTALRSLDVPRRLAAIEALARRASLAAIEPLRWVLCADAEPKVRSAALDALSKLARTDSEAGRAAVQSLISCLGDSGARVDVAAALARLPPSAIPSLAEALAADDPRTRRGVVETLGRITHPAASVYLQRSLTDADAVVRRQAIVALTRFGTRGLTQRFSAMAHQDPSTAVRQAAITALRRHVADGTEGAHE